MHKLRFSAFIISVIMVGCAQNIVIPQDQQTAAKSIRRQPRHGQGIYAEISTVKVKQKMDNGDDIVILDVRSDKEFQGGHLKNAVHIPISEIMTRHKELDSTKETIIYCHSGFRSRSAGNVLVSKGFTKVRNMAAGISGWKYEVIK